MNQDKSIVAFLMSWKRLFYYVGGGAALVSVIISLLLPNWYTAHSSCMPPQEGDSRGGLLGMFSQMGLDFGAGGLISKSPVSDLYLGVLKSKLIRGEIVEQFNLREVYRVETDEHAIAELGDHIRINTSPEGLIEVQVEDRDRQRAAEMANAFMQNLDEFNRKTSVRKARHTIGFIGNCLDESKNRLEEAADKLRDYQQENRTVQVSDQARVTVEAMAELQSRKIGLEIQRDVLGSYAQSDHIKMQDYDNQIEQIEVRLSEFQTRSTTGAGDSLSMREAAGVFLPMEQIPEISLRLAGLMRDVMVQEKVCEYLYSQLEEARIQEARDLETVQILDTAVPPIKKSRPRRSMIVILSVGLAFMLAAGCAFSAEALLSYAKDEASGGYLKDSAEARLILGAASWLRDWGGSHGNHPDSPSSR